MSCARFVVFLAIVVMFLRIVMDYMEECNYW